ncbi:MAG: hypothetical protein Ta2G_17520 [Termitinemataceae bacterium]|nr:MAG: hypothetical protein Ta2G_17520 [Termitinemataceae bacterium]
MNKKINFIFGLVGMAVLVLTVLSCEKKDDADKPELDGVILYSGWVKFTEDDAGEMVYALEAPAGEAVTVLFAPNPQAEGESNKKITYSSDPETKKAKRARDKRELLFYHVKDKDEDAKEWWVQDFALAVDATPAVVISEDVVLYSKADLTSPSSVIIPQYSIVGVHDDKNNFTEVSAYISSFEGSKTSPIVSKKFLKQETLTVIPSDVQAIQLYNKALKTENEIVKKEILQNALSLHSRFSSLIDEQLNPSENVDEFVNDGERSREGFEQGEEYEEYIE